MDLIIATSPIKQTDFIDKAIDSVVHIPFNKRFILFDGLPQGADEDVVQRYNDYKLRLVNDYPDYIHIYGSEHRWFVGGISDVINNYSDTPWCFCIQHDVQLIDDLCTTSLLSNKPNDAKILCFPHIKLYEGFEHHWFNKVINTDKDWFKTFGWSERVFMFDRSYMISLLKQYPSRRFIDTIFYNQSKSRYCAKSKENMESLWNIWKCYTHKDILHKHLVGKTDH